MSDEDYDYENNLIAEFEFDTKLDYFDRVESATGAFSEFSNQDRIESEIMKLNSH